MVSNLSQDNLFVSSYYTKFKVVWDELANYKSNPSCSCGVLAVLWLLLHNIKKRNAL